jgi:hypothetical protein
MIMSVDRQKVSSIVEVSFVLDCWLSALLGSTSSGAFGALLNAFILKYKASRVCPRSDYLKFEKLIKFVEKKSNIYGIAVKIS